MMRLQHPCAVLHSLKCVGVIGGLHTDCSTNAEGRIQQRLAYALRFPHARLQPLPLPKSTARPKAMAL